MASKLIAAQATFTVAFAGVQDGVPSAYGTAVELSGFAKSWSAKKSHSTVNLAAIADTEEQMQIVRQSGSVDLELFVTSADMYQFYQYEGYYAKFILTPKSGGTTLTFTGVITNWEGSGSVNSEQTEKFTIIIGTNGV